MGFAPAFLAGLPAMQIVISVLINQHHPGVPVTMLIKILTFALTRTILPLAVQIVDKGNAI